MKISPSSIPSIGSALPLLLALCAGTCGAAGLDGYGAISSSPQSPLGDVAVSYQDPNYLSVFEQVQFPGSDYGSNDKVLLYQGEAQFGRIGVKSLISGSLPAVPNLSSGVDLYLGFTDRITPIGLNPLGSNFLRLDVSLSGTMSGFGATDSGRTIGKLTATSFSVVLSDPLDGDRFNILATIEFAWFGDNFFLANTSFASGVPRFVPYPGEELHFTPEINPLVPKYSFGTRGFIDVPLDGGVPDQGGHGTFLAAGAPFDLSFAAKATSGCGNEMPTCVAITDFGSTALIGNGRIVDRFGNLVVGAGFASASGYDYITPPDSRIVTTPVPEPETWSLMLAGAGLLAYVSRRRKAVRR